MMPVAARRQTIEFQVIVCLANCTPAPQCQQHSGASCPRPELVSSCHSFREDRATKSRCGYELRTDDFSRIEQLSASRCESNVQRSSSPTLCQQFAGVAISISAYKWQQLSNLAMFMLSATGATRVPTFRQQFACQLGNRRRFRGNSPPAVSVPTQRQQFACQLGSSNFRANSGE